MSSRGMDYPRGGGGGGDPHHPYHQHDRHPDRHHRGRGRGISNAPAWMTADKDFARRENNNQHPHHPPHPGFRRGGPPPPPPPHRRRNAPYGNRSGIYFNSLAEERAWVEDRRRKRRERKSLFDVLPEDSSKAKQPDYIPQPPPEHQHPQADMSNGYHDNTNGGGSHPQHTRHARRLYIGHLPVELTEREVHEFFRNSIETAMGPSPRKEDPILSVYINVDRRFAFVEFKSMELCTACLALDGINVCGKGKVKIKRPNDYNAALAPPVQQLPDFDVSKLGIVSGTVPDGPNKIFIGGLPYHLTEDQVMELLGAFGKVKSFHLVKAEPTASTSKGYCFVEYAQGQQVTPVAVMGLNGMDMGGGKILSARIAATKSDTPMDDALMYSETATFASSIPQPIPTMNVVNGIDVNLLLDAAMGLRPMPTLESLLMEQHRAPPPAAAAPVIPIPSFTPAPLPTPQLQTRVLVLLNMVSDQDFATDEDYNGLVEDVKSECEKFGKLKSYKIPKPGDAYAPSAIRKIFLEYETLQDANQAEQGLAGRSFGPALVEATYFDEQKYALGDLS